ncbi:MAG: hypothetical protein Q7R52_00845 [archaeon]|nr:hypothetical protein [archaeon]
MKNKVIFSTAILTALFSLNLVSAQSFSLSDFFYNIDPSTMILGVVFLISFALINFSLKRIFKDNAAVPAIVALCISLLIVYGLNLSGFDYENWIYGLGISEDLVYTISLVVLPIVGIYVLWNYGWGYLLLGFGTLFGILSYFAYEKTLLIVTSAAFIIIGVILIIKRRLKKYPTQRIIMGRGR